MTLRIGDVTYLPELGYEFSPPISTHQITLYSEPEEGEIAVSLLDSRLRIPFDGASYYGLGYLCRIHSNDGVPLYVETSSMM